MHTTAARNSPLIYLQAYFRKHHTRIIKIIILMMVVIIADNNITYIRIHVAFELNRLASLL